MDAATKKPTEIPALLGCPLLLIAAVFAIPYALIASMYLAFRERRMLRRLASRQRTLPWSDVERHLQAGEGTLIIEQAQKLGLLLWWTSDDVSSLAPVPVPSFEDLDFLRINPPPPFIQWCFERYLSLETGSASLSRRASLKFPPGFLDPGFFTERFPAARVIATVLTLSPAGDRSA